MRNCLLFSHISSSWYTTLSISYFPRFVKHFLLYFKKKKPPFLKRFCNIHNLEFLKNTVCVFMRIFKKNQGHWPWTQKRILLGSSDKQFPAEAMENESLPSKHAQTLWQKKFVILQIGDSTAAPTGPAAFRRQPDAEHPGKRK
ncbi:MAG: hypothetical protein IJN44_08565 [Clostridia bacterium]|nr:hypothetical protein [Clostridia bacterium]